MPTATKPPQQLQLPQFPIVDKEGRPTKEFFDWLNGIDVLIRALRLEIP